MSGYCVWSAPWASSGVDRQNRAPNIKMGTGKMFNDVKVDTRRSMRKQHTVSKKTSLPQAVRERRCLFMLIWWRQASWKKWSFEWDGLILVMGCQGGILGEGRPGGKCRGRRMQDLLKEEKIIQEMVHIGEREVQMGKAGWGWKWFGKSGWEAGILIAWSRGGVEGSQVFILFWTSLSTRILNSLCF